MSQRALLLATRDHLREMLKLKPEECDLTFDGRPFPISGERFVAVWPESWTCNSKEALYEFLGVFVTVTLRLPAIPQDRWGPEIQTKAAKGLDALLEAARAAIHNSSALRLRANAIIGLETLTTNGFTEPLRFRDGGRPEKKSGEWFAGKGERQAGIAQTLTFREAMRIQVQEPPDFEGMT